MTYSRFTPGNCCGCEEDCTTVASQNFSSQYNLDNWLTSGTVTLQFSDRMRLAAGAWAEWDADGPVQGGVSVGVFGNPEYRLHIAHGNGDGFYGEFDHTNDEVTIHNHGGAQLNTFVGPCQGSAGGLVRYGRGLVSAIAARTISYQPYPSCAAASGATGTRVRIEAITQTDIASFTWSRYGNGSGCVRPVSRCGVCGNCDMPTQATFSFTGCDTGTRVVYPSRLAAALPVNDAFACRYEQSTGPTGIVLLKQSGGEILIDAELAVSVGLGFSTGYWSDFGTGVSVGSCGSLGTVYLGSPDSWNDPFNNCQSAGGLDVSLEFP